MRIGSPTKPQESGATGAEPDGYPRRYTVAIGEVLAITIDDVSLAKLALTVQQ